jgi:hypothetical protein
MLFLDATDGHPWYVDTLHNCIIINESIQFDNVIRDLAVFSCR